MPKAEIIPSVSQADGWSEPPSINPKGVADAITPTVIDRRPSYDDAPAPAFTHEPIGDYIVVERIAEPEGLIVEADVAKDKPINCQVIAISRHPSSELAGAALAALAVGDKVLIRRYSGTEVKVNGREYTLVIIFDVLLKLGETGQ